MCIVASDRSFYRHVTGKLGTTRSSLRNFVYHCQCAFVLFDGPELSVVPFFRARKPSSRNPTISRRACPMRLALHRQCSTLLNMSLVASTLGTPIPDCWYPRPVARWETGTRIERTFSLDLRTLAITAQGGAVGMNMSFTGRARKCQTRPRSSMPVTLLQNRKPWRSLTLQPDLYKSRRPRVPRRGR